MELNLDFLKKNDKTIGCYDLPKGGDQMPPSPV